MPKLILTVPETLESVTRPVVFEVARQLFDYTGIDPKTNIFFPGDIEKGKQLNSSLGTLDKDDPNFTGFNSRVGITVEENYEADRMLATAMHRPENLFIFRDDKIETYIKPAYSSTGVTINFSYRSGNKTQATRWRDEIRARVADRRAEFMHSVSYHYLIPEEFLVILKELHRMREAVLPYGQTYDAYFTDNATDRASLLTNLAGRQTAMGIAETQARIQGWFEGMEDGPEQGSKDDEGSTWTVTFSYKFFYDKPIACIMHYPLMVHNQVVKQKFRPSEKTYALEDHLLSYTQSAQDFRYFERGSVNALPNQTPGIAIPAYDEFIPGSVVSDTMRLFTGMVALDLAHPTKLMALNQLSWYVLNPVIESFLKVEAPFMNRTFKSIFVLSLYRNHDLLLPPSVVVDPVTLEVTTPLVLDGRDYHHLRLSLATDLRQLDEPAIIRLRNNPAATLLLLTALYPYLATSGNLPRVIGGIGSGPGTYIPKKDMDDAIDEINRATISKGDGQIRQFNTVMTLFIQTQKQA